MKSFKGLLQGIAVFAVSLVVLLLANYLMGNDRGWVFQALNAAKMLELCIMSAIIAALIWGARHRRP